MSELSLSQLLEGTTQIPKTLALVWKRARAQTVVLAISTLASALLPLGIAYAGKAIVDAVVARDHDLTVRWVIVELVLVALQAAAGRGLTLVRQTLGARLSVDINVMILEKASALDLPSFEDPEFYDRLTRARREASSRPVQMVTSVFGIVQNILLVAGYAAVLVGFSPWVVLALVVAGLPATLAEMRFSSAAFKLRNWRSPDTRRLNYLEYVLATDTHQKEVKVFGLGPMLLERYRKLGNTFYEEDRALALKRAAWGYTLSLVATAAFYGSYVAMAVGAAAGHLTLGELTLYLLAFRQGQQAFQGILGSLGSMYEDSLYMSNLFTFLAIPTTPVRVLTDGGARDELGIRFEGVGFRYPGGDGARWALRGIDLFIPKGQSLALVGHNGAGKTTFIKLLTRLYEPTEGRILLDGRDLRSYEPEALRARLGVVFQDFNEYQFKVKENVAVGSIEHFEEEPRIVRAVDRGGANEVIGALGKGLDTQLGRWFKDGVELSGGQWQKIALARAFMREEADILVLDEPTAALDAEAEHAVFERFRALAHGRTTILISHRFSTVRMADHIVVIEQGHIVEQGDHKGLVAADGRYAHLFSLQAQGYL